MVTMAKAPSFLYLLLLLVATARADPEPLDDFCVADPAAARTSFFNGVPCIDPARARSSDFFTSVLTTPGNTSANVYGFSATLTNVTNFPGINTQGLTLARVDVAPLGVVPPHTHPRSSEAVVVLQGELLVGFVDTSGRQFSRRIRAMEAYIFPRGVQHFQYNPDPVSPVLAIAIFGSQNPGVQFAAATFLSNPPVEVEVVKRSFAVSAEEAQRIRKSLGG
uniref:Germin-like protein n=1 Tax=Anthurium amnicola TaxID=1678845 RepID=A0A1D1XWJ3_9ARAE